MAECALAVIGAGPAGLSAAVAAADQGATVIVLDLGDRPGGQYFRHAAPEFGARRPGAFHHDWGVFTALRDRFQVHVATGQIAYRPRHQVWAIDHGDPFIVRALEGEREAVPHAVTADTVLVATGAHDRHVPFPGWTIPGVMAAGGVQALLKGNLVAPGRRAVVAGTGPFLLSAACGLLDAGVEVAAIVEANLPAGYLRDPRGVLAGAGKLPELAGYAARLARARVPYRIGRAVTAAHADPSGRLAAVTVSRVDRDWAIRAGEDRRLACDLLAIGYGFTPQLELLAGLGCATAIGGDGSLIAAVDGAQRTTVPGVLAAGETTGVGGAALAIAEGTIAGRVAVGATVDPPLRVRRRRLARFASVLQAAHPVADGWIGWLTPDTLVCRCEQVSLARIREAVTLGAVDTRTLKLLARPGMGRCQGRICGRPVATLAATLTGEDVSTLQAGAHRPLAHPVPLAALAHLPIKGADQ